MFCLRNLLRDHFLFIKIHFLRKFLFNFHSAGLGWASTSFHFSRGFQSLRVHRDATSKLRIFRIPRPNITLHHFATCPIAIMIFNDFQNLTSPEAVFPTSAYLCLRIIDDDFVSLHFHHIYKLFSGQSQLRYVSVSRTFTKFFAITSSDSAIDRNTRFA